MKCRKLTFATALTVLAIVAISPQLAARDPENNRKGLHYSVKNLGTLGGTYSIAFGITNRGWVTGQANLQGDQVGHAFLWRKQSGITDLGTLGGPNSGVFWPVKDDRGLIAGLSDTLNPDPLNENFCGLGTSLICLGFLWQDGTISPLPTLGGNNSDATAVNNRGQVVGAAENSTEDPNCLPPQILDFEAVIWGPRPGEIHELRPLPSDTSASALAINDEGQVVGGSGRCGPPSTALSVHAVLWQDGTVSDLGSFGGVINNYADGINDRGQVIGSSDLTGDATGHAFLWTKENGMRDLGTLPGDVSSSAFGINNQGQVVGMSCDESRICRAVLWQSGIITDINRLISPGSSLFLTYGGDINDRGEIIGQAFDKNTGDFHAFLAVPTHHGSQPRQSEAHTVDKVILPESPRQRLQQRGGFGTGRLRLKRGLHDYW